jgi:hypothetical protein
VISPVGSIDIKQSKEKPGLPRPRELELLQTEKKEKRKSLLE